MADSTTYNVNVKTGTNSPMEVDVTTATTIPSGYSNIGNYTEPTTGDDNLGWIGNHTMYQQVRDLLYKQKVTNMQQTKILKINYVGITGYTLTPDNTTGKAGTTFQIVATITPTNATNQTLRYFSNNTPVATVSDTGLVTIVGNTGSAVITVSVNDEDVSGTISVTAEAAS